MHEAVLARAARPAPCECLRLWLRPFSLGHYLLLMQEENPLVTCSRADFDALEALKQRNSITAAVLVCHHTWRENRQRERWLKLWLWLIRNDDFALAIADFRNYAEAGIEDYPGKLPAAESSEIRYIGAPELVRLYNFVAANTPDCEVRQYGDSVWDYPVGLARQRMSAQAEHEGNWEIYNYRMKVHDDFVAEMESKQAAAVVGKEDAPCQP